MKKKFILRIFQVFLTVSFICIFAGCSSGLKGNGTLTSSYANFDGQTVSGALKYAGWMKECLESLKADVDKMVPSAETAARLHVEKSWPIGIDGEPGAATELSGRSGGLMRLRQFTGRRRSSLPTIVLYAIRPGMLKEDAERIGFHKANGSFVVVFGAEELIADLKNEKVIFDEAFSNHVAKGGGLFRDKNGEYVVPMHKTANDALLWAWTGEFMAACTRLGKMPLVYQGFLVTGGLQYAQRHISEYGYGLEGLEFYDEKPKPMPPGIAGRAFIQELLKETNLLVERELGSIRAVGLESAQRLSGHKPGAVRSFLFGHSVLPHGKVYYDPGYFEVMNSDWTNLKPGAEVAKNDLLFYVGYCFPGFSADAARRCGALPAWSIATFWPSELDAIRPEEYLIDQQWADGDAVVDFPGFELKVLPASGFLAEATLWMVVAEVHQRLVSGQIDGDPDILRGRNPWHAAVMANDSQKIDKLIQERSDYDMPDNHGLTALHLAAQLGYDDIARKLLKAGASPAVPDFYGRTPLHLAASWGHPAVIELLLAAGAPVGRQDKVRETALHRAARNGTSQVVEQLLSKDITVLEIKCAKGRTPLHVAAQKGSVDAARVLIKAGAKIDARDHDGLQPIHFAAMGESSQMVKLLLDAGAAVSAQDRWGRIPLHWAASSEAAATTGQKKNNLEVIQELLDRGSNPNSPDLYGRTPLFDAANSSAYEALQILLEHGANPGWRSKNDRLPQDGSPNRVRQILNEYMDKGNI